MVPVMGMARGETSGDRGAHRARGEPVAALAISAHGFGGAGIAPRIGRSELATRSILCRSRSRLRADPAA